MRFTQLIETFVITNDAFEDYLNRSTEQLKSELDMGKNHRDAIHDLARAFADQHNKSFDAYERMSDSLLARFHILELGNDSDAIDQEPTDIEPAMDMEPEMDMPEPEMDMPEPEMEESTKDIDEGPCDVAKPEEIEKMTGTEYDKYAQWKKDCEAEERTTPLSTKRLESVTEKGPGFNKSAKKSKGYTPGDHHPPAKSTLSKAVSAVKNNKHVKAYTNFPSNVKKAFSQNPMQHSTLLNQSEFDDYEGDMSQEEYDQTVDNSQMEYTVWVGGTEANDNWLTYDEALTLYNKFKAQGHDDVQLDARIKQDIPQDTPMGIRPIPKEFKEDDDYMIKRKDGEYDKDEIRQMQYQQNVADPLNREIDSSQKAVTIEVDYDLELDTPKSQNSLLKKHYKEMRKFNVFISMPEWQEGPKDSGFGQWTAKVRGSKENLLGWLKAWEFDYDKEDLADMGLGESAKPDFLDLDKDGNKKEPMKKAGKTKKEVCATEESIKEDEEAIAARDDFVKMMSSKPKSGNKAIDTIKQIVADKQNMQVKFDDGKMKVDLYTASAISQVYDAVKPETQAKIDDMIRTKDGLLKMSNFAFKSMSEGYAPGMHPNSIATRAKPGLPKTPVKTPGVGSGNAAGSKATQIKPGWADKPAPVKPAPVNTPIKTPVKTPVKKPGVGRGHGAGSKATQIQKGGGSAAGKAGLKKGALGKVAKLGIATAVGKAAIGGIKKLGKGFSKGMDASGFSSPLSASKYSEGKAEDIMKKAMEKADSGGASGGPRLGTKAPKISLKHAQNMPKSNIVVTRTRDSHHTPAKTYPPKPREQHHDKSYNLKARVDF